MRRTATIAALLLTASLGFAPAPVYREREGHRVLCSGIPGRWLIVSPDWGTSLATSRVPVVVRENAWCVVEAGDSPVFEIRLNGMCEPATIDLVGLRQGLEMEWRGLVRLDGDTLTLALSSCLKSDGPVPRPTSFDCDVAAPDGRPATVLVFHRVK